MRCAVSDTGLTADDHSLISCPPESALHVRRFIQGEKGSDCDTVQPVALCDIRGKIELLQLGFKPLCICLVPECAGLYSVAGGSGAAVRVKGAEDPFCNGERDVIKVVVKELIVGIRVNESRFHEYRRHLCAAEDDQAGTSLDSQVYESDRFELIIDILCHLPLVFCYAADTRFYT